ncbi:hypothetical protein GCM10020331_000110 [Ectobacillus funiculus]
MLKKSKRNNQVANIFEMDHSVNVFHHIVWGGWLNSVKFVQAYQREMEGFAFSSDGTPKKGMWMQASENLEKVENEINQYMENTTSYFLESLKTLNLVSVSKNVEEWSKLGKEATNHLQQLYGTPSKATNNLIETYFDQIESTLKTTIQQQQAIREEFFSLIGECYKIGKEKPIKSAMET